MVQQLRLVSADPIRPTLSARVPSRRDRDGSVAQTADASAQSALLVALSREVRTTLALVSGYSQILLHLDLDNEERGRYLARISIASERVAELAEEMLSVTASKNDGRPLCQPIAINSLISQVGRQLADEADPPRLIAQLPVELPLVSADPVWIASVLRILVTTTAGGPANSRVVRIGARSTGKCVIVFAQAGEEPLGDQSPVPDSPHPSRVRSAGPTAASAGRSGSLSQHFCLPSSGVTVLGMQPSLDFCRQLVEAHGGWIWLDETASGVRVSFSLPRYWPNATPLDERGVGGLAGALKR